LRSETGWEEASFVPGLLARYRPADFDIASTCAYPFTHWALRRPPLGGKRPKSIFITQNGDWPAYSNNAEFRFFDCDGLVCTNPDYFERNRSRYRCALIPNGVDLERFQAGPPERARFGLPESGPVILMVSALIPSKNVAEGIAAVAAVPNANLVVAGDGPLRSDLQRLAAELLPGRYRQLTVPAADMPALYRSADAFIHLSIDESFGNVFVEAMASGLPVVACDTPRTRWIIGNNAFFADRRDPASLLAAIGAALGAAGSATAAMRERSLEFGWSAVAARYNDFFSELLQ
jgi:glycosyltransferase involved in cell wall biosynthesis